MQYTGSSIALTPRIWCGGTKPDVSGPLIQVSLSDVPAFSTPSLRACLFLVDAVDLGFTVVIDETDAARDILTAVKAAPPAFHDLAVIEGRASNDVDPSDLFVPPPD